MLLAVFALDTGWATFGAAPPATAMAGIGSVFGSALGFRIAIDMAGLAIAGGLFIVPTFSAVQAWAGADRRARVIAAVNVMNAAFMTGGALVIALLQTLGLDVATLFLIVGVACLAVAIAIWRTMPTSAFRDFLSIIFRAFYRLEVQGSENFAEGRAERHRRAEPRELPRRGAGAFAAAAGPGLRHR